MVVENFLECYHCQVAHPSFADAIELNRYEIDDYRYFSTQHGPPKHDEAVGEVQASTNQIIPIDAGHTLAVYEYYYEDDAPDAFVQATTDPIHQVMVEDITLCESAQRGMRTGTFEHGRLMLRYEHAIRHFQDLARESLGS